MDQSMLKYRTLKLNMTSAREVKDVTNFFSKLKVYAAVSITGDPRNPQTKRTHVDRHGSRNPKWNSSLNFTFKESLANEDRLFLKIQLFAKCNFFTDKIIGSVDIHLKDLLDSPGNAGHQLCCHVWKKHPKKPTGTLSLSYQFGDRVEAPPKPKQKQMTIYFDEDLDDECSLN